MTSMIEQFFFFVVENHPWILIKFNESRQSSFTTPAQDRLSIKSESQIMKHVNTSTGALESTLVLKDLESDVMDVLEPLQSDVRLESPSNANNHLGMIPQSDKKDWFRGTVQNVQNTNIFCENKHSGQINQSRQSSFTTPQDRLRIKPETLLENHLNTSLSALETTLVLKDLKSDIMDVLEPPQGDVRLGNPSDGNNHLGMVLLSDKKDWFRSNVQNVPNTDIFCENKRSGSSIHELVNKYEHNFLTSHLTERGNNFRSRNEDKKRYDLPNNIRDLATLKPLDYYENKRKLRNKRRNRARRRNASRKIAKYNEWEKFINSVNNQDIQYGPPCSHSTPKCSIL